MHFAVLTDDDGFLPWQQMVINKILERRVVLSQIMVLKTVGLNSFEKLKQIPAWHYFIKRHLNRSHYLNFKKRSDFRSIYKGKISEITCTKAEHETIAIDTQALAGLAQENLDFILSFVNGFFVEKLSSLPRYGIWSFSFGIETEVNGWAIGLPEIYENQAITGAYLYKHSSSKQDRVILKKCKVKTTRNSLSKQVDFLLSKCISWPAYIIDEIQNNNFNHIIKRRDKLPIRPQFNLKNYHITFLEAKLLFQFLSKLYRNLFIIEKWNVGVAKVPICYFLNNTKIPKVYWMRECKGRGFYADPFGFQKDSITSILFEELDNQTGKGHISGASFNGTSFSNPFKVFELNTHLSYPYIIEYNDKLFCVVESNADREVCLYEINNNLKSWKRVKILVNNFEGIDSSIIYYQERWWLFCTNKENRGADLDLYIFYADDLMGEWKAHLSNPVKTDIMSSRPGGTLFIKKNTLYRPSQDSSLGYGSGIVINRIIKLTEREFKEEKVTSIYPDGTMDPYKSGMHTLSSAGGYTIIDGKRNTFSLSRIGNHLKRILFKK